MKCKHNYWVDKEYGECLLWCTNCLWKRDITDEMIIDSFKKSESE